MPPWIRLGSTSGQGRSGVYRRGGLGLFPTVFSASTQLAVCTRRTACAAELPAPASTRTHPVSRRRVSASARQPGPTSPSSKGSAQPRAVFLAARARRQIRSLPHVSSTRDANGSPARSRDGSPERGTDRVDSLPWSRRRKAAVTSRVTSTGSPPGHSSVARAVPRRRASSRRRRATSWRWQPERSQSQGNGQRQKNRSRRRSAASRSTRSKRPTTASGSAIRTRLPSPSRMLWFPRPLIHV